MLLSGFSTTNCAPRAGINFSSSSSWSSSPTSCHVPPPQCTIPGNYPRCAPSIGIRSELLKRCSFPVVKVFLSCSYHRCAPSIGIRSELLKRCSFPVVLPVPRAGVRGCSVVLGYLSTGLMCQCLPESVGSARQICWGTRGAERGPPLWFCFFVYISR